MPASITLLPEQADLLRGIASSFEVPAWEPAPCRVCSDNFKLIKGLGTVDGHTCTECRGSGYGPQYRMLGATEDEILGGGARRGGKSDAAMMFLIKGNPNEDQRIPYNQSYAYHPKYRALLIRKDQGDLEGFLLQAQPYYERRGGKLRGSPGNRHVQFDSGAVIWTGHLKDASSFEKYIGRPELHRIVVEELTLIPELRFYLILKSSLSTSTPELKVQIMSTTNPPGVGSGWVRDRFVRVQNPDGKTVPWGKTIYVDVGENPFTGKREYNTRVFIPAKVIDNPHVSQDYIRNLMDLPDKERRAYLHGDWDALQGTFFCFDSETDILTARGFKRVQDVQLGENVATRNKNGELLFLPTSAVHSYGYDGDLVTCETPSMNFAVTPNHRMYCEKDSGRPLKGNLAFTAVEDLSRSSFHLRSVEKFQGVTPRGQKEIPYVDVRSHALIQLSCVICGAVYRARSHRLRHGRETTCSRGCSYKYRRRIYGQASENRSVIYCPSPLIRHYRFKWEHWAEFVGWWLAEGCIDTYGGGSTVIISQVNSKGIRQIGRLLADMKLTGRHNGRSFRISANALGRYLSGLGTSSANKRIPRELLGLGRRWLAALFRGLMNGDGHWKGSVGTYYTVSKGLADDVQELAIKLGYSCSQSRVKQSIGRPYGYSLGISKKRGQRVFKRKLKRVPYKGRVSCVTVEHGLVLVRRRGKTIWTGNSEFRNPLTMDLPLVGEPGPDKPNYACHVIVRKPSEPFYPTLSPWWRREMGGDWGFAHESAILWGARDPESQQIHIYRELLVSETGAQTLGHALATKSLDELNASPTHAMTLWFSPDAFRRHGDDEGVSSHVQLIAQGIGTVLGPDAVHIPELEIQQRRREMIQELEFQPSFQQWSDDLLSQQNSGITIRKANNNRILGWDQIRELLAWNSPLDVKGNYDQEVETKILHDFGERAARRYRNLYTRNPGAFPRLQIWDTCPRLMDAFPRMAHDEKNPEDVSKIHVEKASDVMDAIRYLLICFQMADPPEPFAVKEARILAEVHVREPEANLTLVSAFLRANKELRDPPMYANIGRRKRHRHGRVKGGRRGK